MIQDYVTYKKKKQTNKTNQLTLQSSPHDTRALVTEALLLVSLSFLRASVTIAALFLSHRTGSLLPLDLCWLFVLTEGCAHGSLPHLIPVAAEMPPFGEPVYLKYPFHLLFYYFTLYILFCWDKVLLCSPVWPWTHEPPVLHLSTFCSVFSSL